MNPQSVGDRNRALINALLTAVLMLTLAPISAVTALVGYNPDRWDGRGNPLLLIPKILAMAFFGLFTTPLWPTFIPAVLLTPLLMQIAAQQPIFRQMPMAWLLAISLCIGAVAGIVVLSPVFKGSVADSRDLTMNWICAGAVSGAVTLSAITLMHRFMNNGKNCPATFTAKPD